jgi:outer membrane receptor for ferrienterochelin and colicins
MKSISAVLIILLLVRISATEAQETDSLKLADYLSMSLADISKIKVNVSTSVPTELINSPSSVTVLDRELIERFNFMSIEEVVRIAAGVEILQSNLDRNIPTIRGVLQNFYANKVLIMINNTPTWQPINGNGVLDRISLNDVDRIEILKGPASVLYGTNAFCGVINIVLRDAQETSVNLKIDGGYPNLGSAGANYTYKKRDFRLFISGNSLFESRKPYLIKGAADSTAYGQSYYFGKDTSFYYNEEYRKYNLNVIASYKHHSILINNFTNSYNFPGTLISYASGAGLPLETRGTLVDYKYRMQFAKKIDLLFDTHYDYFWREFKDRIDQTESTNFSAQRFAGSLVINYKVSEHFNFEIGAEALNGKSIKHLILDPRQQTTMNDNLPTDNDIREGSAFSQAQMSYKMISLLGGVRYTGNHNFGNNISSRATGAIRINTKNALKLTYGESYRTPNLLELYFSNPVVVGNPNLKPEKNRTGELIYQVSGRSLFFQISNFYAAYSNLIQRMRTSMDPNAPITYVNLTEFKGYGSEIEIKYMHNKYLNVILNYDFLKGDGENASANFRFVPAHTVAMSVAKNFGRFNLSVSGYGYSQTDGMLAKIPAQFLLDANIGFNHLIDAKIKVTHTLSGKNLTKSDMLIPEYIRKRPNVNSLPTTAYGMRVLYSLTVSF